MSRLKHSTSQNKLRKSPSKFPYKTQSKQTGLIYHFDIDAIMKMADLYVKSLSTRLKADLIKCSSLWLQLQQGFAPTPKFETWNQSIFRIVYGGFNPTSVVGSLKNGGRFNIGGPQFIDHQKLLPGICVKPCLYGANTIVCARSEAGSILGKPEEYQLVPQKKNYLWKLSEVITELNIPGLLENVNATPMNTIWDTQKSPLASQLLVTYLRGLGGDGVIFPSTKFPGGKIIAFFFKDDQESQLAFKVEKVKPEHVAPV